VSGNPGSNLPGRKTSLQENEASAFENRAVMAQSNPNMLPV